MDSDWQPSSFEEIALVNPSRNISVGEEAPFIEMAALQSFSRNIKFKEIQLKNFSGSGTKFKDGDVLLARITPCLENGKTALVSGLNHKNGFGSTEFIVLAPKIPSDKLFIYYLSISPDFRLHAISKMEGTSGRQRVPSEVVKKYTFNCPPPNEREQIGNILGSLDDKIELNQRMNNTLESIAQALFKSWFVDFDPVKTKAEGRTPEGMDEEIALLFPESFDDSSLGKIPRGWKVGRVSDVLAVTDFVANGSFESLRDNVKYTSDPDYAMLVRLVDFNHGWNGNSVYISEAAYAFLKKSALEPDDVVIANVGANAGTVFKVPDLRMPMTLGPNAVVVKPLKSIGMNKQYIYNFFSSPEGQQKLQSILSGSAQPKFNKTDMRSLKIVIPSHEVLTRFDQLTKTLSERQRVIHRETETLVTIRDTLLPRLISGKLEVDEISEIEEALAS